MENPKVENQKSSDQNSIAALVVHAVTLAAYRLVPAEANSATPKKTMALIAKQGFAARSLVSWDAAAESESGLSTP